MGSRGTTRGRLIHLMAGMALGAAVVLMAWIVTGGQPFGRIIGTDDVSDPTTVAVKQTAAERRAASVTRRSARLGSRPPELVQPPEIAEPKAKVKARARAMATRAARTARAERRKRAARRARRRTPVVRVVAPPSEETVAAPVAAVPGTAPTAAPEPAAPPPAGGAGGGAPKASPPGPKYWVGEG